MLRADRAQNRSYIRVLSGQTDESRSQGKTAGLRSLVGMGLNVPMTYVCSARACADYVKASNPRSIKRKLKRELSQITKSEQAYAVRSSALGEDSAYESMAGQLVSSLSVSTPERIAESVEHVWKSEGSSVQAYRRFLNLGSKTGPMEVLIQEMVDATCAGVSFSRNPVTGAGEVIVEAVEGTSEAFLQGTMTPKRFAVADESPVSNWPVLPTSILDEIVNTTRKVATNLGYPADLEWAYDGEDLWWLQVRPITSLRGLSVYSNRISREYLPGLVKPLVWSINVPMINGAWVDLFEVIVGRLSIDPLSLARRFHCRAYFNMSGMGQLFQKLGLPKDTLEQLLGTVPSPGGSPFGFRLKMLGHLPRLIWFLISISTLHWRLPRWSRKKLELFNNQAQIFEERPSPEELIAWVNDFLPYMREAAYYRILTLMLHFAIGQLGRRVVSKRQTGEPATLELSDPQLENYDPQVGLQQLSNEFLKLPQHVRNSAKDHDYEEFFSIDGTADFKRRLEAFLDRFGHISESGNDFSTAPWREDPTAILHILSSQTQTSSAPTKQKKEQSEDRVNMRWARRVTKRRVDRERVADVFSQGFYLLHRWSIQLGQHLTNEGILDTSYDLFHFELDELRSIVAGDISHADAKKLLKKRREEMEKAKDVSLPEIIVGEYAQTERKAGRESNILSGVPTSRGVYEGPVCVVRSIDQSHRLHDGDVLVVPYSDVAWTHLFARAGAIVAEAGGMLSHSSIVAREFRKPAVVSVDDACTLLDGKRIQVNGHQGTVTIIGDDQTV